MPLRDIIKLFSIRAKASSWVEILRSNHSSVDILLVQVSDDIILPRTIFLFPDLIALFSIHDNLASKVFCAKCSHCMIKYERSLLIFWSVLFLSAKFLCYDWSWYLTTSIELSNCWTYKQIEALFFFKVLLFLFYLVHLFIFKFMSACNIYLSTEKQLAVRVTLTRKMQHALHNSVFWTKHRFILQKIIDNWKPVHELASVRFQKHF